VLIDVSFTLIVWRNGWKLSPVNRFSGVELVSRWKWEIKSDDWKTVNQYRLYSEFQNVEWKDCYDCRDGVFIVFNWVGICMGNGKWEMDVTVQTRLEIPCRRVLICDMCVIIIIYIFCNDEQTLLRSLKIACDDLWLGEVSYWIHTCRIVLDIDCICSRIYHTGKREIGTI